MKNIVLLYASSSGNTEQIAMLLKQQFDEQQFTFTIIEMSFDDIDMQILLNYDCILFGTYSYDDGDVPYEVENFYDDLSSVDLSGKVVGVFGSGDMSYPSFCGAVDLMKAQFVESNAIVMEHTVKVDLYPEEKDLSSIVKLAKQIQVNLS